MAGQRSDLGCGHGYHRQREYRLDLWSVARDESSQARSRRSAALRIAPNSRFPRKNPSSTFSRKQFRVTYGSGDRSGRGWTAESSRAWGVEFAEMRFWAAALGADFGGTLSTRAGTCGAVRI